MTSNILKTAAALAGAGMLTGCMATGGYGSSSLIGGLAGAIAMDMLLDGVDGGGGGLGGGGQDFTYNPAMLNAPDLGDPELTALQARMTAEQASFTANQRAQLSVSSSASCAPHAHAIWLAIMNLDPDQHRDQLAAGIPDPETIAIDADCPDGLPDGPYVMLTETRIGETTTRTHHGRVQERTAGRRAHHAQRQFGPLPAGRHDFQQHRFPGRW